MIDFSNIFDDLNATPCHICKAKHAVDICPRCLSSRALDRELKEYLRTGRPVDDAFIDRYDEEVRVSSEAFLRELSQNLFTPLRAFLKEEMGKL